MKRNNLFTQWRHRIVLPLFTLGLALLGGCSNFENQPGQEVTVSVGSESYAFNRVAPEEGLALALLNALVSPAQAALISDTYPFLSRVTLGIQAPGYTLATINNEYNGGKFFLTADGSAIELSETPVTLRVPEGVDITFTVTAYGSSGYQYMTGSAVITAPEIASGAGSVAVTMAVDIDPNLPLQASLSGCTDTDGDDWCDVYEDLFVTASGSADLDGDGQPNSNDPDADGDGILDVVEGNSASNDGFPLYIHANTAPTFVSLPSLVVDESGVVNGSVVVADADLNDSVTLAVTTPPAMGSASVSGTTLSYTSLPGAPGSYTIGITASDSQGATAATTVTVVVNDIELAPLVVNDTISVSTISLQAVSPLSNDIEYDGQPLSLTGFDAVTASGGSVRALGATDLLYTPPVGFTGSDTFNYTASDGITPVSGTVAVTVFADADGDGADDTIESGLGLSTAAVDSDGDGFSDQHELEAGSLPDDPLSLPAGTVISTANSNNVITTDTLWELAGSPYWLQSPVTVSSGASLTILPGVAVKVAGGISAITAASGASLYLYGGGSDGLVTQIVSERDDTVQGDTNGDGASTSAQAGDYGTAISDGGANAELEHVHIAHATTAFSASGSSPKLKKVKIEHYSNSGIILDSTTTATLATIDSTALDGMQAGLYGIQVLNQAGTDILDSTIVQNTVSAVALNTSSAVSVVGSTINNNTNYAPVSPNGPAAGIDVLQVGAGSVIKHNLLRSNVGMDGSFLGNAGVGAIGVWSGNNPLIANNLIIENQGGNGGAGIHLGASSVSTIVYNTIADSTNSCGFDCGGSAGLWIDSGASATINHNVLADNSASGWDVGSDVTGNIAGISESYNLAASIDSTIAPAWVGTGDIVGVPTFTQSWYQFRNPQDGITAATSPAVDKGASATLPTYLAELTAPTTSSDGTVDTSVGDLVDLGFHYNGAPAVISTTVSTLSSDLLTLSTTSTVATLTIEPRQADGTLLPPGQRVTVSCTICNGAVWIYPEELIDRGDGSYELPVYYGYPTTPPVIDTLQATVNGIALNQTISITSN